MSFLFEYFGPAGTFLIDVLIIFVITKAFIIFMDMLLLSEEYNESPPPKSTHPVSSSENLGYAEIFNE